MLSIGAALILLLSHVLSAQPKRKPTGSLEGVWSYATLTPFERPEGFGELFTDAQAAEFEAQTIGRNDRDRRDGGAAADAAREVADYWFDRGEHVGSINGKKRTSWVIDPPDGGPSIGLGPYNNFLQIFQARVAVVIDTEMIHDARLPSASRGLTPLRCSTSSRWTIPRRSRSRGPRSCR